MAETCWFYGRIIVMSIYPTKLSVGKTTSLEKKKAETNNLFQFSLLAHQKRKNDCKKNRKLTN